MTGCNLQDITIAICSTSSAGINQLWLADCEAVESWSYDDAAQVVDGVNMSATFANPYFYSITFEQDTAFYNQVTTRNGNSVNVAHTISFVNPGASAALQTAIEGIYGCCCLVGFLKCNDGQLRVIGVDFKRTTGVSTNKFMSTGDGSHNSGANPANDVKEFITTLSYNSPCFSSYSTVAEADIPVAP